MHLNIGLNAIKSSFNIPLEFQQNKYNMNEWSLIVCLLFALHLVCFKVQSIKIMSRTHVQLLICLIFVGLPEFSAELEMSVNPVFDMQKSISQCTLNIAKSSFRRGSIIAAARSGIRNVTNLKLAINTNDVVLEMMMKELEWSLLLFQANASEDYKKASSYHTSFVITYIYW